MADIKKFVSVYVPWFTGVAVLFAIAAYGYSQTIILMSNVLQM